VLACEQLAMHYERHTGDLARALEFAQLGLKTLQRQLATSRDPYSSVRQGRHAEKFVCRVERLAHRIESTNAASGAPLLAEAAVADGFRRRTR
jgi:hypothetical protein